MANLVMKENIFLIAVLLGIHSSVYGAQCPDLIAGSNMLLTDISGWVDDPPITITCTAGYVLDIGVLQKEIVCISVDGNPTWNDTVGLCQKKQCPNVTTTVKTDMYVNDTLTSIRYYGDTVTLACDEGNAFELDYTLTSTDRVMTTRDITCIDDSNSTMGRWEDPGNCSQIVCPPPPKIYYSINDYDNTTLNTTTVTYECLSGTRMYGYRYSVVAVCNSTAEWSYDNGLQVAGLGCYKLTSYVGCLTNGSFLTPTANVTNDNGNDVCIVNCREQNKGLAGIYNDTCWCADYLHESHAKVSNSYCDQTCPGYNISDPGQQVFCGGTQGEMAVFTTMGGCYDMDTIVPDYTEIVYGGLKTTCKERCRGEDYRFAAAQNPHFCNCFNDTQSSAVPAYSYHCKNSSNSNVATIMNLQAVTLLQVSSCLGLYEEGIRMNGDYYISNTKTSCVFFDDTVCDPGWIGFNGHCYYFNTYSTMNFNDGRDFCTSVDANLVSITSQAEFDFLKITRDAHDDLRIDEDYNTWWLGMVDSGQNLLYSWVDGSIMTLLQFLHSPETEHVQCAIDDALTDFKWAEHGCNGQHQVMCKKPAVGPRCISTENLMPNISIPNDMVFGTYCIEFCKGQQLKYAVYENTTCHCMDTLPSNSSVSYASCNFTCPGHQFQFCGGENGTYSVVEVSNMISAVSCEELNLYGLDNNTFAVQNVSGGIAYTQCGVSACPPSWILLDDVCYKYQLVKRNIYDAIGVCAKEDSYMASIETTEEIDTLISAAQNISLYKPIGHWRIGLLALSKNGGYYRWSNGRMTELPGYWSNDVTGQQSIVVVRSYDATNWVGTDTVSDQSKFICEKGLEYIGCFEESGVNYTISLLDYSSMTIQQCVEICRANNKQFAYLNPSSCVCGDSLTNSAYGLCLSYCNGQRNQICGGTDVMSVYDVTMYQMYNSCEELYDASIFISGTYNINGTLQYCNFLDTTVCNDTGWLGLNGHCYKHYKDLSSTHAAICSQYGSVQTSLTSIEEFQTLKGYTRRVNNDGGRFRIFTGINHGGYNMDVFVSQEGFLTDNDVADSWLYTEDLYDNFGYVSFYTHYHSDLIDDGGVICKKDIYRIGCYEKPTTLSTIMEEYGSMEIGLCRQMCLHAGDAVTLMGNNFCACAVEADLASLTASVSAECDVPCSLHVDQKCGSGTIMWAYDTYDNNYNTYAKSCEHLYRNGIFYNTTYLIMTENDTLVEEQCGYADDTTCDPTFLGKTGSCFKVYQDHALFHKSRENCFIHDSYLFNPVHDWVNDFVESFIVTSGLLDGEDVWVTGIVPIFYNISYVMSNGHIIEDYRLSDSDIPTSTTIFNITHLQWFDNNMSETKPTICQKDSDYLGCNYLVNVTSEASYTNCPSNSLTQCMYWCKGSNYQYAAIHQRECHCYHSNPILTSAKGDCDIVCDAVESQMCGGIDIYMDKVFNVINLTEVQDFGSSCQDLFKHGILKPGWYNIHVNHGLNIDIPVKCFNNPPLLEYQFLQENVKSIIASSIKTGYTADDVKIMYPFSTAWKPDTDNTNQFVKIVLDFPYMVTGFVISGLHKQEEQSYVTSFSMKYRDVLTGTLDQYTEDTVSELSSNCNATAVLCFRFLTHPIVTNEIHLLPVTWLQSISLQVAFAGQLYSQFNHSDTYIGCILDPGDYFNNISIVNDTEHCRDICRDEMEPFASIDSSNTCWCGHGDFQYGFVDETNCPILNGSKIGNGYYKAIHRTFYKHCGPVDDLLTNGSAVHVYKPHNDTDVYPYLSKVHFECDPGFELPSNIPDMEIECLQSNQWSLFPYNCTIIQCPSFTVHNGMVNFTSMEYQSTATVTCMEGFWTIAGLSSVNVHCRADKTWSQIPHCSASRGRYIKIHGGKSRLSTGIHVDGMVRSETDCAAQCTFNSNCTGANFNWNNTGPVGGSCRVFEDGYSVNDLQAAADMVYFQVLD